MTWFFVNILNKASLDEFDHFKFIPSGNVYFLLAFLWGFELVLTFCQL